MNEDCIKLEKQAIREKQRELKFNETIPNSIIRFLIKKFKNIIVAYSGGTDSTALLALMDKGIYQHKKILDYVTHIIYNNTKMESPKTFDYVITVCKALNIYEKLHILKPQESRTDLEKIIKEDYEKFKNKQHSKNNYRCCFLAKEKPMIDFLNNFSDETVVLTGVRISDSDRRFKIGLMLISSGNFYFFKYKNTKAKCSTPIFLLENQVKKKILTEFCEKYSLEYPEKSGCVLCPIFNLFANKSEQNSEGFEKNNEFFGQTSIKKFLGDEFV